MQDFDTPIQRRADGTIDMEHYIARGRRQRARTFHDALPETPAPRGVLAGLAAVALAVFTFRPPGA